MKTSNLKYLCNIVLSLMMTTMKLLVRMASYIYWDADDGYLVEVTSDEKTKNSKLGLLYSLPINIWMVLFFNSYVNSSILFFKEKYLWWSRLSFL